MFRNRIFVLGILLLSTVVFISSCSTGTGKKARDSKRYIRSHHLEQLPNFDMPVEMNDRVVAWMEYFQGPGRGHFRRYMERSGRYVPLMQEILKKEGMPRDLIYLALIESGFNTQAYSSAKAAGPWQFIQSTGKQYGLRVNAWTDERRDPYKSTKAAIEFLKDLYQEFGDWYLAMAAYNAGQGRVRSAISMTGSKNFWVIADDRRALRPETRDYVPKFIAAAIIGKMPERFGFDNIDYKEPFDFDKGAVETQTDLSVIAKCAGVDESDIFDLNPHLIRGSTPPDERSYDIRLPKGTSKRFHEKYALLPREERVQMARHGVRRGETLAKIARRYGVSASQIAAANGLAGRRQRLTSGMTLMIPRGGSSRYAAETLAGNGQAAGKKQAMHTVRRGETLSRIADRYGVSTRQLMAWNGLKSAKAVHTGTRLVIGKGRTASSPSSTTAVALEDVSSVSGALAGESVKAPGSFHVVQKGETLGTIARRYGVTTKQLMELNDIQNPKTVRAGMKLALRVGKVEAAPGTPVLIAGSNNETRIETKRHKVRKGETIASIAKSYGVTQKQLMTVNNIKSQKGLRAGMSLMVKKEVVRKEAVTAKKELAEVETGPVQRASVEPPQNVMTDAGTSMSLSDQMTTAIPEANSTPVEQRVLAPAETPVKLGAPHSANEAQGELSYQVKNGDTLWDIARRHKVTIAQIQKKNNLSDPSAVKPGVTIKIPK